MFYISVAVIALMIIGFADPYIPLEQTKEGVNVVLVIDVSGSMQADDYPPNRLESAKSSSEILLQSLQPKVLSHLKQVLLLQHILVRTKIK